MKNLENVVRERNKAYYDLEVGETGERPGQFVTNFLGKLFNFLKYISLPISYNLHICTCYFVKLYYLFKLPLLHANTFYRYLKFEILLGIRLHYIHFTSCRILE